MHDLSKLFATDFQGGKPASMNKLPTSMKRGSQLGAVITVANTEAIRVAMSDAITTQILIVDIEQHRIDLIKLLLEWAGQSKDMPTWAETIRAHCTPDSATRFLDIVKDGNFEALKTRLPHILTMTDDLSRNGVVDTIKARLGSEKVGVIYASNIEYYLGSHLFSQAQASKSQFQSNLFALMEPDSLLIRSDSVFMNCHEGLGKAKEEWKAFS